MKYFMPMNMNNEVNHSIKLQSTSLLNIQLLSSYQPTLPASSTTIPTQDCSNSRQQLWVQCHSIPLKQTDTIIQQPYPSHRPNKALTPESTLFHPDPQKLPVTVYEISVNDLAQSVSNSTNYGAASVDSTRQSVKVNSPSAKLHSLSQSVTDRLTFIDRLADQDNTASGESLKFA